MKSEKIEAIVLKRINLNEADRIVTVFSFDRGKIKFIAKGVRKIKSKNAGSVELFTLSEFLLYSKGKLDVLTGSQTIRPFPANIPLEKINLAGFLAKIYLKNLPDDYVNEKLFNLLDESYKEINKQEIGIIRYHFIAKYLKINGTYFELENCLKCGKKITVDEQKRFLANGVVCSKCSSADYPLVSTNTIKILRLYSEMPSLAELAKIKIKEEDNKEAKRLLDRAIKQAIV